MAVCVDLIGAKLRLLARHGYKSMKASALRSFEVRIHGHVATDFHLSSAFEVTLVYPPVRLEPTTIPPGGQPSPRLHPVCSTPTVRLFLRVLDLVVPSAIP